MTRTLKLTLAYEGTNYAGWQIQRRASHPTIQGTLQEAFRRIVGERVRVVGSGRTDAGVHALVQVAHARVRSPLPCERLQRALNAVLPPDIVVTKVEEAPAGFHARFGARVKRYRYRIVTGGVVLPFERRYVHHVRVPLDAALMRREAKALRGRHDMRAFHKLSRPVADARRTISQISVRRRGRELTIELEANGFLHGMVRSIVGTLIDVGRGHRPPGTMAQILKARERRPIASALGIPRPHCQRPLHESRRRRDDRRLVGSAAPAKGLCLVSVRYRK